jgi:cysteine-rich repeat protein
MQKARRGCRCAATQAARPWQWAIFILFAVEATDQGSGGGACRGHTDCGAAAFCAPRSCATTEGYPLVCGVCKECAGCSSHFEAIDARCPAQCGAPVLATNFLRGPFFSVDSAQCLSLWHFEGHTFQRFRTGFSYTWLSTSNLSVPGDGQCRAESTVQRGVFSLSALDGRAALMLRIPQDSRDVHYLTYQAHLEQAQPGGLALSWGNSLASERLVPFASELQHGNNTERLGVWAHQAWKGTLQVFDTLCEAMLELQRVPTPSTAPSWAPALHFWRINTWDCVVGKARAPGMPDLHARSTPSRPVRVGGTVSANSRAQAGLGRQTNKKRRSHWSGHPAVELPTRLNCLQPQSTKGPPSEWPRMPEWVLASPNTTVMDFESWNNNDSWLLSIGDCSVNGTEVFGDGHALGCATFASCRRAVMKRHLYEWIYNKNNTACMDELQPTRIARCVCDFGYIETVSKCVDSTLNHTRFVQQTYSTSVARAYKDQPFLAARCTEASQIQMECTDIDECTSGTHNCHPDAQCNNNNGSFTCLCLDGYRDAPTFFQRDNNNNSNVSQGVECVDIDECAENTHTCHLHAQCNNTKSNYTCTCRQGLKGDGRTCTHLSEVQIERVWQAGVKLGLFFNWHVKVKPHPRDLISIDVQPEDPPGEWLGKSKGRNLQFFWFFLGAQGCTSQLTVAVGAIGTKKNEFIMDCHDPSDIPYEPWASFHVQQLSPGYGTYTARLFSYHLQEVVATHRIEVVSKELQVVSNSSNFFFLELQPHSHDLPGMAGGLRECVSAARLHPHLPFPLSPTVANPELTHTCATLEIPTFQGTTTETQEVPVRCGDGRLSLDGNEACDDGNTLADDGCSAACAIENHTSCTFTFNTNILFDEVSELYSVNPPDSYCIKRRCGDTRINVPGETCDDGNINSFDGCSSTCTVETGFFCQHSSDFNLQVDPPVLVDTEKCEPFVVRPWPPSYGTCSLAARCHPLAECVLFEHTEFCSCRRGYSNTGAGGQRPDLLHNALMSKANLTLAAQYCQDVDE